jgi:hypothetical protein
MTKRKEGDGCTDFTDFHTIFTDWACKGGKIRENRVKIREIRTSITLFSFFVMY